jgi:hypothetical protein
MKIKTISVLALIAIFSLSACVNSEQKIKDKQKELVAIQPKAEKLISEYDELRSVINLAMQQKEDGVVLDETQEAQLNFLIEVSGKKAKSLDSIAKIAEKLRTEIDALKKE